MSTQNENGIEFSILPEENLQHFRLLDLPAELLKLVTSDDPPIIQLKSTANATGNNNVVLCTPNKTFDLRQVSTSNSVFVAQSGMASDDPDGITQPWLQAIARPTSTLEVVKTTQLSALPYMASLVPMYTSTGHYSLKDKITKEALFSNIPLSDAECEAAWRELACFELGDDRDCVMPTAYVKLKAWKQVLEISILTGNHFTSPLDARKIDQIVDVAVDVDLPPELLIAILRSVSPANGTTVDPDMCARVTGKALLKTLTDTAKGPVSFNNNFVKQWTELLPDLWRSHAQLSCIEGSYRLESEGKHISFVEDLLVGSMTADSAVNLEGKSTLGAKRKWHEKFRAAKKTA